MKLSKLKINANNPQTFDDLSKLENSIKEFPKMMSIRPMVYDPETFQVLGGNKRLICLQNLGYKDIPDNWVQSAADLTEQEKKRFVIADNVGFGEWDMEILDADYDSAELEEWGLEFEDEQPTEPQEDVDLSDNLKETYEIIIECGNASYQEAAYEKLIKEGYTCRVLTL